MILLNSCNDYFSSPWIMQTPGRGASNTIIYADILLIDTDYVELKHADFETSCFCLLRHMLGPHLLSTPFHYPFRAFSTLFSFMFINP